MVGLQCLEVLVGEGSWGMQGPFREGWKLGSWGGPQGDGETAPLAGWI